MRFPMRTNLATRVLAVSCCVTAGLVVIQLLFPATMPESAEAGEIGASVPEIVTPPAYVPPTFDTFAEVLERPLLFAERRLPQAPVEKVEQAPREPLRLWLEGVALTSASRVALLRDQRNNALVQVAEGMMHNGWTLEKVERDKAIFVRDSERTELTLEAGTDRRRR